MMVMRRDIETVGRMALSTDAVAGLAQLARVRIVAIGTGHAGCMHLALQERTMVEYFVALLAVGIIEPGLEACGAKCIVVSAHVDCVVRKLFAPCMASGANLQLDGV